MKSSKSIEVSTNLGFLGLLRLTPSNVPSFRFRIRSANINTVRIGRCMTDITSFSELRSKLDAAREEYQRALQAKTVAWDGLAYPDGSPCLCQTREALRSALRRYLDAFNEIADYMLGFRQPRDRSGSRG